jgi:hypothetical protein
MNASSPRQESSPSPARQDQRDATTSPDRSAAAPLIALDLVRAIAPEGAIAYSEAQVRHLHEEIARKDAAIESRAKRVIELTRLVEACARRIRDLADHEWVHEELPSEFCCGDCGRDEEFERRRAT